MDKSHQLEEALALLDSMIVQQREKVLKIGQRLNPRATADDLLNPFDWPEIAGNPQFNFEDGLLAGLVAAHVAVSARIHEEFHRKESPQGQRNGDPAG